MSSGTVVNVKVSKLIASPTTTSSYTHQTFLSPFMEVDTSLNQLLHQPSPLSIPVAHSLQTVNFSDVVPCGTVHPGYLENRIPLKPALGGVYSLTNYSVAYEEIQSNRFSDFRDFVCSFFVSKGDPF